MPKDGIKLFPITGEAPADNSSSGGGSKRILAATLTYTGSASAAPKNTFFPTVTGSLPDPASVLAGGTLQSIDLEFSESIVCNVTFSTNSVAQNRDYLVTYNHFCYIAGFTKQTEISAPCFYSFHPSGSTGGGGDANGDFSGSISIPAGQIASWPDAPFLAISAGLSMAQPDAGLTVTWSSFSVSGGTIKAYYIFD